MDLSLSAELLDLARARRGVLATAELRAGALDRSAQMRRVEAGLLEPERHGVVVVAGLRDRFSSLAARQLVCPDAVAERRTAAAVWELDGFREHEGIDLAVAANRRREALRGARLARIPESAITLHDGLRVTAPGYTLNELGACADVDADLVELAVESALRDGRTTEDELRTQPGLVEVLARRTRGAPPTESYAETRFLQRVVRHLGLEDPERQVPIHVRGRRVPYRMDFVFRRAGRVLDVEIDGLAVHGTPMARDHDLRRDEAIQEAGCVVKRIAAWRIDRNRSGVCRGLMAQLRALEN